MSESAARLESHPDVCPDCGEAIGNARLQHHQSIDCPGPEVDLSKVLLERAPLAPLEPSLAALAGIGDQPAPAIPDGGEELYGFEGQRQTLYHRLLDVTEQHGLARLKASRIAEGTPFNSSQVGFYLSKLDPSDDVWPGLAWERFSESQKCVVWEIRRVEPAVDDADAREEVTA